MNGIEEAILALALGGPLLFGLWWKLGGWRTEDRLIRRQHQEQEVMAAVHDRTALIDTPEEPRDGLWQRREYERAAKKEAS